MVIDVELSLTVGDTLVLLIVISDGTQISNVDGNKQEWPVSMAIGKLCSKIRQVPSTHIVIMVALLAIPITNCNILQMRLDKQRQTNREVLNVLLRWILPH
jgi:hypothetical protein